MQPHIRRWHTRYRVIGASGHGVALMEGGVRERVAEPYAAAIERALTGDPSVYVLRRLHTDLTVSSLTVASEGETARRWAAQIYAGVLHTVTREAGRTDLVVRFEDTAEYVARFVVDLIDGVAWDRWFYGAFSAYRGLELGEALRRLLVDFADELPAIFRRLAAMSRLGATIARLSCGAAADVWRSAIRPMPEASPEAFRIFMRTALALADALELWTGARPSENELLLLYLRTSPRDPDWKQPHALAEAVYAAFQFLGGIGSFVLNRSGVLTRFVHAAGPLLDSLEWLDHEWLAEALRAHLSLASTVSIAVAPRSAGLSPLQIHVLEVLFQLLEAGAVALPESEPQSHANALTLFAALSSAQPTLAGHTATPALIEWLLARWKESGASPLKMGNSPVQQLASLIAAILQREAPSLASTQPPGSSWPKRPVPEAGAPALRSHERPEGDLLESSCAGIFLLSRAVIEGRATQLASALGLSPPGVLLALAAEWTGVEPDAFDPGVLFWTGCDRNAAPPSAQVRALDGEACERLCAAIERLLRDRAAFAPSLSPVRPSGATPVAAIALHLLRLWAHWLPGFAQASANFLLNQLIRRRGHLRSDSRVIAVALRPATLDVVLQMAGYLKPISAIPWLLDRRATFTIDPAII